MRSVPEPSSTTKAPASRQLATAQLVARFAWPAAFVAALGMTFSYLRARDEAGPRSAVAVEHASPTVVKELRALGRLETTQIHLEKVIDVKDHQKTLFGLVDAEDGLLFVASGEVVLGVDLAKIGEDEARFDEATSTAYVTLPPPEILSTRFDEVRSYVHARDTDLLARRNERLESHARKEALTAFEHAAREPEAIARSKAQAEKQLGALARAWGARELVVRWSDEGVTRRE
jgi:hypothetical protein